MKLSFQDWIHLWSLIHQVLRHSQVHYTIEVSVCVCVCVCVTLIIQFLPWLYVVVLGTSRPVQVSSVSTLCSARDMVTQCQ